MAESQSLTAPFFFLCMLSAQNLKQYPRCASHFRLIIVGNAQNLSLYICNASGLFAHCTTDLCAMHIAYCIFNNLHFYSSCIFFVRQAPFDTLCRVIKSCVRFTHCVYHTHFGSFDCTFSLSHCARSICLK